MTISPFIEKILAGVTVFIIITIIQWVRLKYLKKKYEYICGKWVGSYLIRDDKIMLTQKIIIKPNYLGKLKITIEEESQANYIYNGEVDILDNVLFSYLSGEHHQAKSFIVMKLPFNRKDKVPAMNGVFSGINQLSYPSSVKVHWSRNNIQIAALKKELGSKKKVLFIENEATQNVQRLDISENLKSK